MDELGQLYQQAEKVINELLAKEIVAQGHHLTGALEDSLSSNYKKKGKAHVMEGTALHYAKFVNDGFPAESASMKQFPFLVEYFKQRGYPEDSASPGQLSAKALAAMTIRKWMKEGMPTQSSKRFSSTGSRTGMIESAFIGSSSKIDDFMSDGLDFVVEQKFKKEKSEKI